MRKLYGDSLRKEAGFVKVIKNVASKNARLLESRAGRHAPEIKRVAKEVKGTFEKVFEETADIVEEFLAKCEFCSMMRYKGRLEVSWYSQAQNIRSCAGDQGASSAISGKASHYVSVSLFSKILFSDALWSLRRVANDLSSCDVAKYKISICSSRVNNKQFHLGEPIRVQWQAPQGHSRSDWIGVYRVCTSIIEVVYRLEVLMGKHCHRLAPTNQR